MEKVTEQDLLKVINDLSRRLVVKENAYMFALDTINDLKRENVNLTLKLRMAQGK